MSKAADPSIMMVVPGLDYAPEPFSRRPFYQIPKCVVIFDADGKPVSCVQNAPWFFHVDQCHDPLKGALQDLVRGFRVAATMSGFSPEAIAAALAEPIAALHKAGVKVVL